MEEDEDFSRNIPPTDDRNFSFMNKNIQQNSSGRYHQNLNTNFVHNLPQNSSGMNQVSTSDFRQECKYGLNCTRKTPHHFVAFKHSYQNLPTSSKISNSNADLQRKDILKSFKKFQKSNNFEKANYQTSHSTSTPSASVTDFRSNVLLNNDNAMNANSNTNLSNNLLQIPSVPQISTTNTMFTSSKRKSLYPILSPINTLKKRKTSESFLTHSDGSESLHQTSESTKGIEDQLMSSISLFNSVEAQKKFQKLVERQHKELSNLQVAFENQMSLLLKKHQIELQEYFNSQISKINSINSIEPTITPINRVDQTENVFANQKSSMKKYAKSTTPEIEKSDEEHELPEEDEQNNIQHALSSFVPHQQNNMNQFLKQKEPINPLDSHLLKRENPIQTTTVLSHLNLNQNRPPANNQGTLVLSDSEIESDEEDPKREVEEEDELSEEEEEEEEEDYTIDYLKKHDLERGSESLFSYADTIDQEPTNVLTEDQKRVLDYVLEGYNIFYTGPAGTGKSFLLEVIVQKLKQLKKKVALTASTGVGASNVGGITVHSWAGIGTGESTIEKLFYLIKNGATYDWWLSTEVLIIDEISMISGKLFDTLNQLAKKIRGSTLPFGGIQLILVGDFFQLPPVIDKKKNEKKILPGSPPITFCFESKAWKECINITVELRQVFRQDNTDFVQALNEIRVGQLTSKTIQLLNSRVNSTLEIDPNIIPTKLFPLNKHVDEENRRFLQQIDNEPFVFQSLDSVFCKKSNYLHNFRVEREITLKVGCQVMLLKNTSVEKDLINGSRGVVVGWKKISEIYNLNCNPNSIKEELPYPFEIQSWLSMNQYLPIVKFSKVQCIVTPQLFAIEVNGAVKAKRVQLPLKLAWALTIHKCISGSTLLHTKEGLKSIASLVNSDVSYGTNISANFLIWGERELKKATQIYKGFKERGIRISTNYGFTLEGSYRHPILILDEITNSHLWKKLPELKLRDKVVLKLSTFCGSIAPISTQGFSSNYSLFYQIPSYIDETCCFFLGMLVANGRYESNSFSFQSTNFHLIEIFKFYVMSLFQNSNLFEQSQDDSIKLTLLSSNIEQFLLWCGLEKKTNKEMSIPWVVLENTIECQKSFLYGFYCCQEESNWENYSATHTNLFDFIERTTIPISSVQLGKQLQILLGNLGILSCYSINKSLEKIHLSVERFIQENETFYDSIALIESIEKEMYDLYVPQGHDFVANGFVNHNSQGLTLDCVEISMGDIFEPGQAYVALSRVRNLEGLRILNFSPSVLKVSLSVLTWYKSLTQTK